jgi:tetratricopeptide (TPR) repeat protein
MSRFVFIIPAFIIYFSTSIAQNTGVLQIDGIAEHMMEPLPEATVELFKGNTKVSTINTDKWGRFKFTLDLNSYYTVVVSKDEYVAKRIDFDTKVPVELDRKYYFYFALGLLTPCDGVDFSLLKKPVDVVAFHDRKDRFISDKDYTYEILGNMELLMWKVQECLMEEYDQIIDDADKLYNEGNYREARKKYMLASQTDPYDRYPGKKIDEIGRILALEDMDNQKHKEAIELANEYFQDGDLKMAHRYYRQAAEIKPDDQYSNERLNVIEEKLNSADLAEKSEKEEERQYYNLINRANSAFYSKNYEEAKSLYEEVKNMRPNDPEATERLAEINEIVQSKAAQEQAEQEKEAKYQAALTKANNLFSAGSYEEAKIAYQEVNALEAGNKDVNRKINEIDRIVAEQKQQAERTKQAAAQKEIDDAYNNSLNEAESLLAAGNLEGAKVKFEEAKTIKPANNYPNQKIGEINTQIADKKKEELREQAIEASYTRAIEMAKQAIAEKKYAEAKSLLDKANSIKPGNSDAPQMLAQINTEEAEIQRAKEEKETQERNYKLKVTEADNFFNKGMLEEAQAAYQEAQNMRPGGAHVQDQIAEVQRSITKRNAERAKQEELDRRYDETVKFADGLLLEKKYNQALEEYRRALVYKPDETYPNVKIADIEKTLEEIRIREAELAKLREEYRATIAIADNYYANNEYEKAIAAYKQAKGILSEDSYPDDQILKINQIIENKRLAAAKEEERKARYNNLIKEADGFFATKNYTAAKTTYQSASEIMSNEPYPKEQIARIDNIVAQLDLERQQQEELQQKYDEAIASADEFLNAANLAAAKSEYEKALRFLPEESYPKQRIKQINDQLALLAQAQQQAAKPTPKPKPSGKGIEKLSFKNPSEKAKYQETLKNKYGKGITLEIYEEKFKKTERFIVIRNGEVNEFRRIVYNWGIEYYHYDIQTTKIFFDQQTKKKGGENFKEIIM